MAVARSAWHSVPTSFPALAGRNHGAWDFINMSFLLNALGKVNSKPWQRGKRLPVSKIGQSGPVWTMGSGCTRVSLGGHTVATSKQSTHAIWGHSPCKFWWECEWEERQWQSLPLTSRFPPPLGTSRINCSPSVVWDSLVETRNLFSLTHEWRADGKVSLTDHCFPQWFLSHAPHGKPSTKKKKKKSIFWPLNLPSVLMRGCQAQSIMGTPIAKLTGPEWPEGESCSLKAFKCCYIFTTTYWRGELFSTPPSPEAQPLRLPGNLSRKHVANSNQVIETSGSVI